MALRRWATYLMIFAISLLLFLIITPLRGVGPIPILRMSGVSASILVSFVVYYLLTLFFLKRYGGKYSELFIVLSIFLGATIDIPLRFIDFELTLVTLPDFVFRLLAIASGYWFTKLSFTSHKIALSVSLLTLTLWFCYCGTSLWTNKINFGTFTGRLRQEVKQPPIFQDNEGNEVDIRMFKGKFVVLDFWISSCGICYLKFPLIQELYDRYRDDISVVLYGVHCCSQKEGETYETGTMILQKEKYNFPCLSITMDASILKELGVNGFPTVLVLDPEGRLIYRGNAEGVMAVISKL